MNRFLYTVFVVAVCATFNESRADLVLGLQFNNGVDPPTTSKSVTSGTHFFVDLLITDTDGSTPLVAEGLLTGGGRLVQTSGGITLTPVDIVNPGSQWDGDFQSTLSAIPPDSSASPLPALAGLEIAKVFGQIDFFGIPVATIGNSAIIATFEFVASGATGSTATIFADILNAQNGNFTYGFPGTDLDAILTSTSNFSSIDLTISGAAAVPEPATVVLGSMSLCMAGAAAWRRRRNQKNSDVSV